MDSGEEGKHPRERRVSGSVLFGRPWFWLLLQMALVYATLASNGRLDPVRHADTESYYISAEATSLTAALSHYRTYGYGLFLKSLGAAHLGRDAIPPAQAVIYLVAVWLFWVAFSRYGHSGWLGFAAASPLLYAPILDLVGLIQPDFLAAGLVILAVAFLLFLATVQKSRLRPVLWLGLTLAAFLGYQVRPAALFLVVWLPLVGGALYWLGPASRRHTLAFAGRLSLATALPFVVFAFLRPATVGHFGLVSFGGYNLAAVASSFVDQKLLNELPKEVRPTARRIHRARTERGWRPMTPGAETRNWFGQYNDNLWRISLTVAWSELRQEKRRGVAPPGLDRVIVNDRLTRFSRRVIKRRPGLYLQWVRDAFADGVRQLGSFAWIRWPFILIMLTSAVAWLRGRPPASEARASIVALRALATIALIGTTFFALHLLLISLVSLPYPRYTLSTILFLPSALCALLFEMWRRIAQRA